MSVSQKRRGSTPTTTNNGGLSQIITPSIRTDDTGYKNTNNINSIISKSPPATTTMTTATATSPNGLISVLYDHYNDTNDSNNDRDERDDGIITSNLDNGDHNDSDNNNNNNNHGGNSSNDVVSTLIPIIERDGEMRNDTRGFEDHQEDESNESNERIEEAVWEEDSKVKNCPTCNVKFTFFNRRHHCRKCGHIFCNKCSNNFCTFIPGSYVIEPEDDGGKILVRNGIQFYKFRTCDQCYSEIKMLKEALGIPDSDSDSNSDSDSEGNESGEEDVSGSTTHIHNHVHNHNHHHHRNILNDDTTTTNTTTNNSSSNEDMESSMILIKHSQPQEITMEVSDSTMGPNCDDGTVNRKFKKDNTDELNECPVCGMDLSKFKEEGGEREKHINGCLTAQEFGSPIASGGMMKRDKNRMLVYSIPLDADMSETVINDDNECVICLEDFQPGDKLARLECLCCFHYKCIKDWIKKKGYCECPVHSLHTE